ncbi:MAG: RsmG family class I SAM-dependent methyltransferase, partial [Clostridia bacterium]
MLTDLQLLLDGANSLSISLSDDMVALFSQYFDMVVDSNKLFNLTAITDEKDFIVKHFVDSLCAEKFIPQNSSLCDIGAGAGFPSVPLAIVRQDLQVTAL